MISWHPYKTWGPPKPKPRRLMLVWCDPDRPWVVLSDYAVAVEGATHWAEIEPPVEVLLKVRLSDAEG